MAQEKLHFKTALFDMDGVLYDSMKNHAIAYRESLTGYGIDMPVNRVYEFEGMKGTEAMRIVAEEQYQRPVSEEEAAEMYEAKCQIYRNMPKAEKIPGVEHLMQTMKAAGMTICVVTGSGQLSLINRLTEDFNGLIDSEHIVSSKDYSNGKPSPDPYLTGLARCNAKAEDTIVVENAPLGVRAGKAAGIFTIAVNTGPLSREIFEEAGADMVFNNMQEAEEWLTNRLG